MGSSPTPGNRLLFGPGWYFGALWRRASVAWPSQSGMPCATILTTARSRADESTVCALSEIPLLSDYGAPVGAVLDQTLAVESAPAVTKGPSAVGWCSTQVTSFLCACIASTGLP